MEALILAAGITKTNEGFPEDSKPKCLFHVKGNVILERLVYQLYEAGVDVVHIAIGYKEDMIRDYCTQNSLQVHLISVPNWDTDAGDSILVPLRMIKDDILIVPGDLYCDTKNLREIVDSIEQVVIRKRDWECYILKVSKELIPKLINDLPLWWNGWENAHKQRGDFEVVNCWGIKLMLHLQIWALHEEGTKVIKAGKQDIDRYSQTDEGKP